MNIIKQNFKAIVIITTLIISYTAHATYITNQNIALAKANLILSELSEVEKNALEVKELRGEWEEVEATIWEARSTITTLSEYKANILEPKIREAELKLLGKEVKK